MSQMSLRKMRSIALAHLLLVLFAQGEATKKLLNLPDQIAFDPTFDTTGYNQEPYSDDLLSGLLLTNPFQEDSLLDADSLYNEIYEPEEGPLSYMPVFETPLNLFSDEFLPNDITDENRYDLGDLMQGYEEKNPRRFEKRRPSFGHAFVGKRRPSFGHAFVGKRRPSFGHAFVGKRRPSFGHAFVGKRDADGVEEEGDEFEKRQPRTYGHTFVGKRTTAVNPGYGHDFIGKRSVEQPDEQSNEQAVATQFSENKRVPGYGHDFVVKRSVNDEHASIHKRSVDSAVDVERDSEYADSYMDKRQSGHAFVGKRRPSFGHAFVGKRRPSFGHAFVGKRRPSFGHAFVGKRRPSFGHAFVGKRDHLFGHAFVEKRRPSFGHAFVGKRRPSFGHAFVGKRRPSFGHAFVGKRIPRFEHAFVGKRSDEDDTIPGEIVNSEHPFLSKENSHEADQAHEAEVPYPRTEESFASSKREAKNSVSDT